MATPKPATVAISAAAMPGAIEFTLTSPAAAIAAKVIITPTTVPSRPRNGPPAMEMVNNTILLFRRCVSRTSRASMVARMASSDTPLNTGGLPALA